MEEESNEDENFYVDDNEEEESSAGLLPKLVLIRASTIRGGSIEEPIKKFHIRNNSYSK